jgi:hypothetical protein
VNRRGFLGLAGLAPLAPKDLARPPVDPYAAAQAALTEALRAAYRRLDTYVFAPTHIVMSKRDAVVLGIWLEEAQ